MEIVALIIGAMLLIGIVIGIYCQLNPPVDRRYGFVEEWHDQVDPKDWY